MTSINQLHEIRDIMQDEEFYISTLAIDSNLKNYIYVIPKKVKIKSDLTVWDVKTGACIINGMHNFSFFYDTDLKKVKESFLNQVKITMQWLKDGYYDSDLDDTDKSKLLTLLGALKELNLKKLYKKL